MIKNIKPNKGSFSVEAILVVSTVIFVTAAVIYSFLLLYHKALLTKAASLAAQQGAEIWADSRKNIENGRFTKMRELTFGEIYYNLFDDFSSDYEESLDIPLNPSKLVGLDKGDLKDNKLLKIRQIVYSELGKQVLRPASTKMKIDFSNAFIQRKITVTLKQEIKLPGGEIGKLFGGKETMTLTATGVAVVVEPTEYIRNIDLILEYASGIHQHINSSGVLEKINFFSKK